MEESVVYEEFKRVLNAHCEHYDRTTVTIDGDDDDKEVNEEMHEESTFDSDISLLPPSMMKPLEANIEQHTDKAQSAIRVILEIYLYLRTPNTSMSRLWLVPLGRQHDSNINTLLHLLHNHVVNIRFDC